jgi:alginate O-acetyltransferase complex protein AlgI
LATGIWHGANVTFLFWGIYHGFFQMLEEFVPWIRERGGKAKQALMHIYTMLVVCIGFVFFRADTMSQGFLWVKRMFTGFSMGTAAASLCLQQLTPLYLVTFVAACIASMPVCEKWKTWKGYETFAYVCSMAGLVLCMLSLAGGTYNPFIYFRF